MARRYLPMHARLPELCAGRPPPSPDIACLLKRRKKKGVCGFILLQCSNARLPDLLVIERQGERGGGQRERERKRPCGHPSGRAITPRSTEVQQRQGKGSLAPHRLAAYSRQRVDPPMPGCLAGGQFVWLR